MEKKSKIKPDLHKKINMKRRRGSRAEESIITTVTGKRIDQAQLSINTEQENEDLEIPESSIRNNRPSHEKLLQRDMRSVISNVSSRTRSKTRLDYGRTFSPGDYASIEADNSDNLEHEVKFFPENTLIIDTADIHEYNYGNNLMNEFDVNPSSTTMENRREHSTLCITNHGEFYVSESLGLV